MSLLNSLYSAVSGLNAHQTMLDVIGNNIANVNTLGYKSSSVTFADTFSQFVSYGTNGSEDTGGVNSYQIGLGTKVSSINSDWSQGTFESTGSTTDLALEGDGLFVLSLNGSTYYSRAGNFEFDSAGNLVDSSTGAIVQGKMATDDGVIPAGNSLENIAITSDMEKIAAVATKNVVWTGNLSSASSVTRSQEVVDDGNLNSGAAVGDVETSTSTVYDPNGTAYTLTTTYTKTAADAWDMTYSVADEDGNVIVDNTASPESLTFDTDGSILTGTTSIPVNDSGTGIDFDIDISGVTQTATTTTLSTTVDDNREATAVDGTVTVYDSLGESHILTVTFTKTSDNNWNWSCSVPSDSGTITDGTGTITFDQDGAVESVSSSTITLTPEGGASSQNITLDFGESFGGITQSSSDSVVSATSQDGSASATLSDISIDSYGVITGVYSNGYTKELAQILVATFSNTSALTSVGDNMYTISANTGSAVISEPGETSNTTIESGALEQSNVDLSEEFTSMIIAQRGFQANARIVTVSDDILQETTNLVR